MYLDNSVSLHLQTSHSFRWNLNHSDFFLLKCKWPGAKFFLFLDRYFFLYRSAVLAEIQIFSVTYSDLVSNHDERLAFIQFRVQP